MDDMKRLRRLLVAAGIGIVAGTVVAFIFAAEGAVHIWIHPQPDPHDADAVVARSDASWQPARATNVDALETAGNEYVARVLDWFGSH
jgi:hypothetical protein